MSLRSSQGVVAWIIFTSVIPWTSHGMTPNGLFDPRKKCSLQPIMILFFNTLDYFT
ncbi:MAG TPA: hypothetical protein LFW21_04755 [Rickettsia endosymbiont of Pyrocoelia pectoralis]|nr:hypothetical protein [Rickettsia endosymbiont of Pyrocoelia pectoralis]